MEVDSDDQGDQIEYYIDIVERSNRFGVFKDLSFKALSNFKLDVTHEVVGPLSGYLCTVKHCDGSNMG